MNTIIHRPCVMNLKGSIFRNYQASSAAEAILRGLFKQVREILTREGDPNETVIDGKSALILCTLIKDNIWTESLVRQLLECGGRLDQKDGDGNTALHYAIIHNRTDIIDVFFDAVDFDLNVKNKWGFTPLHYAVDSSEKIEILSQLLTKMRKLNYSIDTRNNLSCSPLMEALRHLSFEAVDVLINNGAKADFKVQGVPFVDFLETLKTRCRKAPYYLLKIRMSIEVNRYEDLRYHDALISKIKDQTIFMAPDFDVRNDSKWVKERPKSVVTVRMGTFDNDDIKSWKRSMPILLDKLVDQSTESYRKGLSLETILLNSKKEKKNGIKPKLLKRGPLNQEKSMKKKYK